MSKKRNYREATTPLCESPVYYAVWGREGIDAESLRQMENACRLPISVRGAQMPDGHVGYGLPIGGVLATRGAVIPYGVGVDIACRMKLSVAELPADRLAGLRDRLKRALQEETAFGMGAQFRGRDTRQHDVMDDPDWDELPGHLKRLKEKAWSQLGSSGSGNHFVEWGEFRVGDDSLGIPPGDYLALLSHSGSRGFGNQVATFYTNVAMEKSGLPKEYERLAWLDLDSHSGREYWLAMNLAGKYASANHDCIHRHVLKAAGVKPILQIENHHNFAWLERHNGEEVVVHRKGATPAGEGVLGIIPGSMGDPGFVVRGRGSREALDSAAHGAGRVMSRKRAKETITRHAMAAYLKERGVELMAGGLDEAPQVYKPIRDVMAAQADLVEPVAEFMPRIVMMAEDGGDEG